MNPDSHVLVIGGGAGAAAARVLKGAGLDVTVLEAAEQAGGRTTTVREEGFSVDSGAIFVMGAYRRTLDFYANRT